MFAIIQYNKLRSASIKLKVMSSFISIPIIRTEKLWTWIALLFLFLVLFRGIRFYVVPTVLWHLNKQIVHYSIKLKNICVVFIECFKVMYNWYTFSKFYHAYDWHKTGFTHYFFLDQCHSLAKNFLTIVDVPLKCHNIKLKMCSYYFVYFVYILES